MSLNSDTVPGRCSQEGPLTDPRTCHRRAVLWEVHLDLGRLILGFCEEHGKERGGRTYPKGEVEDLMEVLRVMES